MAGDILQHLFKRCSDLFNALALRKEGSYNAPMRKKGWIELDTKAATTIMGWERRGKLWYKQGEGNTYMQLWAPTKYIAQAMLLVKTLKTKDLKATWHQDGMIDVSLGLYQDHGDDSSYKLYCSKEESLALAITKACLATKA